MGHGKVLRVRVGYVLLGSLAHDSVADVDYPINKHSSASLVLVSSRVGRLGEGRNEKLVRCPRRIPGPAGATENRLNQNKSPAVVIVWAACAGL